MGEFDDFLSPFSSFALFRVGVFWRTTLPRLGRFAVSTLVCASPRFPSQTGEKALEHADGQF